MKSNSLILFGTETGTAEDLAGQLSGLFKKDGVIHGLKNMADMKVIQVSDYQHVFIIVSTWGDGEPPSEAEDLYNELSECNSTSLKGVGVSVFALGDSSYPDFCQAGIDFEKFFKKAGAAIALERVDADIDYEDPFEEWASKALASLKQYV